MDLLKLVDILIAGPYIEHLRLSHNLTGSSNQQIHFLTDRYRMQDMARMPAAEVQIDPGGNIIITGIGGISKDRFSYAKEWSNIFEEKTSKHHKKRAGIW